MPFRLIGIFALQLEQFFLTRDFPIFSSSSSFFFIFFFFFFFFLSHSHFTTATPFRVCSICQYYSADHACCGQSPSFQLFIASTAASLVSYGVVRLRMSHNELHSRMSFSPPFCLELLFVAPIIL